MFAGYFLFFSWDLLRCRLKLFCNSVSSEHERYRSSLVTRYTFYIGIGPVWHLRNIFRNILVAEPFINFTETHILSFCKFLHVFLTVVSEPNSDIFGLERSRKWNKIKLVCFSHGGYEETIFELASCQVENCRYFFRPTAVGFVVWKSQKWFSRINCKFAWSMYLFKVNKRHTRKNSGDIIELLLVSLMLGLNLFHTVFLFLTN